MLPISNFSRGGPNLIVDVFIHEYAENLARYLNIKTDLPIYAIYDIGERIYSWGINYFHYFVKVNDDYYLNAKGLSTENELKEFWAEQLNIPNSPCYIENLRIVKKSPYIYDYGESINFELDRMGAGREISPVIKEYGNQLINLFLKNDGYL